MADNSIVGGMFGVDPEQYQQQQALLQSNQNMQLAQLDPLQSARYSLMQGGTQLGNAGMQLLGIQDPVLKKASELKQIASQFDATSPEGLTQMAKAAMSAGYAKEAQQAIAAAQKMQAGSLANEQAQFNVNKIKMSTEQEAKMREELSALPASASDEQILSVIKKYAGANELLKILEMKQIKAGMLEAKNAPIMEAARAQKEASVNNALDALTLVDDLKKKTTGWTTGLGNTVLAKVPLSAAKDYAGSIETLKSKLGADILAEMKMQSKTGATGLGALNMSELKLVQTKIANIDPNQSPAKVQESLDEVARYYQKRAGVPVTPRTAEGDAATSTGLKKKTMKFGELPQG